jgi:dihydrolipoamide dehydrogenase
LKSGKEFDLAIVGGGPGGYVAAVKAAQLGARVALVESRELGGTCLNRGCIPSKVLLQAAELAEQIRQAGQIGLQAELTGIDLPKVMAYKERVVSQLRKGVEFLMKQNKIEVFAGVGSFQDAETISVNNGEHILRSKRTLVATGSAPARIPLPGGEATITSDEALFLEKMPASAVIIGGGSIGIEFAQIFSAFGAKVAVIEVLDHILPLEEEEIVAELARVLKRRKIEIHTPAKVEEIRPGAEGKTVVFTEAGARKEVGAELVLMAVGRRPELRGLEIEKVGIELERGAVKVNARMETNVPGLYACGDVIGGLLLAHVASAEGKVAVTNALGGEAKMSYEAMPVCVYGFPEVASVGLSEEKAKEQGREVKVGRFFFRASGKALAMGERNGLVKIVADARTKVIVGGQIVGPHATDLIAEVVLAVARGMTAEELGEVVHGHPTLSEPIAEAAEDVLGRAIHK